MKPNPCSLLARAVSSELALRGDLHEKNPTKSIDEQGKLKSAAVEHYTSELKECIAELVHREAVTTEVVEGRYEGTMVEIRDEFQMLVGVADGMREVVRGGLDEYAR